MKEQKPFKTWHLTFLGVVVIIFIANLIYASFWPKTTIKIGGRQVYVLIADSYDHRLKGWSGKKDMGKYGGMLFVFAERGQHGMVMRDMHFPLDIIWLDGYTIVDIAPNVPPEPGVPEEQLTIYQARAPSTAVLELPAGFRDQTGLKIGDTVEVKNY